MGLMKPIIMLTMELKESMMTNIHICPFYKDNHTVFFMLHKSFLENDICAIKNHIELVHALARDTLNR